MNRLQTNPEDEPDTRACDQRRSGSEHRRPFGTWLQLINGADD
jgi:hypothetical protein